MTQDLLQVEISHAAQISLSTLGDGDRRIVHSWLDHLRNWRHDDFTRSRAKSVAGTPSDVRVLQTSNDIMIAFRVEESAIVVLSIFRAESLHNFQIAPAGGSAA